MMAELRSFPAKELKAVTGETVVLATDKSMNRFVKKTKITKATKNYIQQTVIEFLYRYQHSTMLTNGEKFIHLKSL